MKTRQGFVSNSSSSSFVFLGYKKSDKIDMDAVEKIGLECTSIESVKYEVIGEEIGRWGDDDWSVGTLTASEFAEKSADIKKKYQELYPNETIGEPELVYGMMVS